MKPALELPGSSAPRGQRGGRAREVLLSAPGCSALALVAGWRAEVELLRRRGAGIQADVLAACADELAEALHRAALEELTVSEAAAETGYSASAIRRRFPGRKTIQRGELPRKGGRGTAADGLPDLAGELLARRARGAPA